MSLSQDLEKAKEALIEDGMKIKSWAAGEVSGRDYTSLSKEEKENIVKEIAKIVFKGNDLVSPCEGTIDKIDLDNNSIEIEMVNGLGLRLKVCKKNVDFKKDVTIPVKEGQHVISGQVIVEFKEPVETKSKLFITTPILVSNDYDLPYDVSLASGSVNVQQIIGYISKDAGKKQ